MAEYYNYEGMNYIGGEWRVGEKRRRFMDINPADVDHILATFPEATKEDVEEAVEIAHNAQRRWATMSPLQRGRVLFRAAEIMDKSKNEFIELITIEEGKTKAESTAEVYRTIDILRFFGAEGWRLCGETLPSEDNRSFLFTVREPLGVVAVITPWNFPLAIPAWKICPALIAGNSVIFKPASLTPLTGMRFVQILEEAGVPEGVLNFLTGAGSTVGEWLVEHPDIKAISFTGSYDVGSKLYVKASRRWVRTQAEMGGKNAVVVAEDADINEAVEIVCKGAFSLSGQACTATSRAIVVRSVYDKFLKALEQRVKTLRIGNGLAPGVDMGPVASEEQLQRILFYIKLGQDEGAELLAGGVPGSETGKGFFVKPTVFINVEPEMRIAKEEIFGPVLCVLKARDFDEAIEITNAVDYGLVASVCTKNLTKAYNFLKLCQTGIVKINQPTIGVAPHAPFGGIKRSSFGGFKEQGRVAIEFFSYLKTVYLTWEGKYAKE